MKEGKESLDKSAVKVGNTAIVSVDETEHIFLEIVDCEARETNILIYKVPESSYSDRNTRISHDSAVMDEIQVTVFKCS